MKLIDDWKQVWKWYSTHAMVIYMALVSYYVSLEPTVKEQIPNWMLYTEYRDWETDRKSTRLNSSHITRSRMPSSA